MINTTLLVGHTAMISGGLGDIGRAIALTLAEAGANVALGDLADQVEPPPFLERLQENSVQVRYDRVDVTDPDAVASWVATVEREIGTPDLIVPNAAVSTLADLLTLTPAQWRQDIAVGLDGAFYLAQAAAKRLVAQKLPGRIVFIGSWAAEVPHPHVPAYSVAKAGLRQLCKTFALALAPHQILVNEVAPGYVNAGLSRQVFTAQPQRRAAAENTVPVGALITPDEVAREVLHLCRPENRHTTGSTVLMDGGLSLLSPASFPPQ